MNYILGNDKDENEEIENIIQKLESKLQEYRFVIIKNATKLIIIENLIEYRIKFILLYIKRI